MNVRGHGRLADGLRARLSDGEAVGDGDRGSRDGTDDELAGATIDDRGHAGGSVPPQCHCRDDVEAFRDATSWADELTRGSPTVFATVDGDRLLLLRTSGRRVDPCPWCVRLHTTTPERTTADRATAASDSSPNERTVSLAADRVPGVAAAASPRSVTVLDPERGASATSTAIHKHPDCSHGVDAVRADGADSYADGVDSYADDAGRRRLVGRTLDYDLYDPTFGVVREVAWIGETYENPWAVESDLSVAVCRVKNPAYHRYPDVASPYEVSSSAASAKPAARLRAIMEGLERFAAFVPAPTGRLARESEVGAPTLTPDRFHTYSERRLDGSQFPFEPYAPSSEYNWIECDRLGADERVFVPSDFVYLTPGPAETNFLLDNNTSGCAAHRSLEDATRNAVLELVERDALMRHWYGQRPRPHVAFETLPASVRRSLAPVTDRYDVHVVDATRYEGFPTVEACLVARDPDVVPAFVVGAGCERDPRSAVAAAVREAIGILQLATTEGALNSDERIDRSEVRDTADHLAYYSHHDRLEHLSAFLEPASHVPLEAVDDGKAGSDGGIRSRLSDLDVTVLRRDLTPPFLRSRYDVRIVRALSPDLVPIHFGYGLQRTDHPDRGFDHAAVPDRPHPFA